MAKGGEELVQWAGRKAFTAGNAHITNSTSQQRLAAFQTNKNLQKEENVLLIYIQHVSLSLLEKRLQSSGSWRGNKGLLTL